MLSTPNDGMPKQVMTMDLVQFKEQVEADLKKRFGPDTRIWMWREYNGVRGFFGTGLFRNSVIIWITERPSLPRDKSKEDKFPDWMDNVFYEVLAEEGFQNIHLTDFVKIMGTAGERPTEEILKTSADWMKREIETLKVEGKTLVIVANTKNVRKWIELYLAEFLPNTVYIPFFKHIINYTKKEYRKQAVRNVLRRILSQ